MLFCTYEFFLFFLAVAALIYLAPDRWRNPILLVASYLFYASWNWRFIPLLASLTVIDFAAAIWIEGATGARRRKLALLASLAANLGFLGFFKYYNFAASTFAGILGQPDDAWRLAIVLPLGISFHTFQSISYVVDVYRGEQRAERRFLDYALFIAFFPQLVAGPIVRAHRFFADLASWRPPKRDEVMHGALLIVTGVMKKLVFADNFALVSDRFFANPAAGIDPWAGIFAFSMQIYFDFSGYTDIAIGSALLLGFHFPINFRRPYLATGITDFWRRWHISLSSWLRDYVYIPLGGNRHGGLRTYRNLMLTMLLGGLWHGANWTFVVWGAYHGALLSLERALGTSRIPEAWSPWRLPRCLLTFVLVSIGWVFFRAASLPEAFRILGSLTLQLPAASAFEPALLVLLAAAFVLAILEERSQSPSRLRYAPAWAVAATAGLLLFITELFTTGETIPFVYFQF